jgi:hypothetical protein
MNSDIESKIQSYLSDETQLYQDWYTGLNPDKGEQYATPVRVDPDSEKFKKLFEKWFRQQRDNLNKLCDKYCEKRQQFTHQEPLLIAAVADGLTAIFVGVPMNVAATATILSGEKFLDRLCGYPKKSD